MHDLSFHGANCNCSKLSQAVENRLTHCCIVVSVEELSAQLSANSSDSLLDLGLCLKPTQVEEFPISSVPNANTVPIGVAEGIHQHAVNIMLNNVGARIQPCLTPLVTGNASEVSVVLYSGEHAIVELTHHSDKSIRAAKLSHFLP